MTIFDLKLHQFLLILGVALPIVWITPKEEPKPPNKTQRAARILYYKVSDWIEKEEPKYQDRP